MEKEIKNKIISKKTVKKSGKTLEKELRKIDTNFFFSIVLAIMLIPLLTVFMLNLDKSGERQVATRNAVDMVGNASVESCKEGVVSITTNKGKYGQDDTIALNIENGTSKYIYFEPCDDLNVFEKFVDGQWVLVTGEEKIEKDYQVSFEKKDVSIECVIGVPESGAGFYRSVVSVYYGCKQPSRYGCEGSEIFYSNGFEVIEGAVVEDVVENDTACISCAGRE
ncbi:MAG: hypothetical protein PHI66_05095 [Candidatus Pacebacteria bacterium]|nr:hypothetical protein [Candidatus Paceibacterota bacterium]